MRNPVTGAFNYAKDFQEQDGSSSVQVDFYKKRDGTEMVMIKKIGDRNHVPHFRAGERFHFVRDPFGGGRHVSAKEIWPEQYAAFKAHGSTAQGTPLVVLQLSDIQVHHLAVHHIQTVEQLASASERALQGLGMGAQELKDRALDYLDSIRVAEEDMSVMDQIGRLEQEKRELQAQIAAMSSGGGDSEFDDAKLWDEDALRAFLTDNDVKLHGGWKRPRLVHEAKAVAAKLQEAA